MILSLALTLITLVGQAATPPGPPPLATAVPPLPHIDPTKPTLFLIGDSTVKVGTAGQMGWGEAIGDFFDPARINIVNFARGGRSSRTFVTEGLWIRAASAMRPGDYVLIQFGHNDGGELFETTRPRGSLPGIGDETREGTVTLTQTFEVVHTYGWYLRKYIADVKARGATPIICSPVPHNRWRDGHVLEDRYAGWAKEVAQQTGAAFIDLHEIISKEYEDMGPEKVAPLFADVTTHTTPEGARLNARAVIDALKAMNSPLTKLFAETASK
jgi:rhamnogalacturonan acetylesterase